MKCPNTVRICAGAALQLGAGLLQSFDGCRRGAGALAAAPAVKNALNTTCTQAQSGACVEATPDRALHLCSAITARSLSSLAPENCVTSFPFL